MNDCVKTQKQKLDDITFLKRYEEFRDNTRKIVQNLREKYIKNEIDAACQKDSKCNELEKAEEKADCLSMCKE